MGLKSSTPVEQAKTVNTETHQDAVEIRFDHKLKHVWETVSMTDDGIIMIDGSRIYIPSGARKDILHQLHKGHCGYGKTLQTAWKLYYWPSMKYDIRSLIDNCEKCQQLLPSKPVEPFIATKAEFPMDMISTDLFHVGSKNYMVTVDRYSGYFWVDLLRDLSTRAITGALDRITRIFGIPLTCRTEGGPQFQGPFEAYCRDRVITHETSLPYNPRSNGHAEDAVKFA